MPIFYGLNKFKVVARLKWDEQYAPPNWDKEFYKDFNNGEPDIVFMVFDPKRGKESFYDKLEGVENYVTNYAAGVAAQTKALKKPRSKK